MKVIFTFLFVCIVSLAFGTTYYISPTGSDTNPGTINNPFFTLNKAWSVVSAGDIIYLRGGTYRFNSQQKLSGKNGTVNDTIKIFAYPGERPVLSKSATYVTPGWPQSLIYLQGNYTWWKGIEIAGYTQATAVIWYAMALRLSNNNRIEQLNSHHNGHGLVIRDGSSNNLVLNSDFHHNYDPMSSYGDGDGIEIAYHVSSATNTMRGCRMWNNADDGLDLWDNNGNMIVDNCWAWNNGYREDGVTQGGDGGGFKFGKTTTENGTEFKRTFTNCIAVYNRLRGFNQNAANVKFHFYNNIAYQNKSKGIEFYSYDLAHIVRNNICFENPTNWSGAHYNAIIDHNSNDGSWQTTGPVASAADFISLDTAGISGPRKPDGSLPYINFMHLAEESDLIDAGVDVGLPYFGSAPDIGAFERNPNTSVISAGNKHNLTIYPNPARNFITVSISEDSSEPQSIRIYNLLGELCLEKTLDRDAINQVQINFKPGLYIVQLRKGSSIVDVQKLNVIL